ncbi:magnesium chelatase subunit H [Chloroflexota bacterium]
MVKFLLLSTIDNTRELRDGVSELKTEHGDILSLRKVYLNDLEKERISLDEIEEEVRTSHIILVDIRGQGKMSDFLQELLSQTKATIVVLIGGSSQIFALTRMGSFKGGDIFKGDRQMDVDSFIKTKRFSELTKKIGSVLPFGKLKDMRNWIIAQQYYANYGKENLKGLLLFLAKEYGGARIKNISPPRKMLDFGIWWPDKGFFSELVEFQREIKWNRTKPTIGVFIYSDMHLEDCAPAVREFITTIGGRANIIPVFSKVEYNLEAISKYFFSGDAPAVDLMVNMQYFRLHGGPYGGTPEPTYDLLRRLNVPVLIGFHLYTTEIEEWRRSTKVNPLEVVLGTVLPELDGCIEPLMVSGLVSLDRDETIGAEVKECQAIPERVAKLASRVLRWISLREKGNEDKKLALVLYDYPPGEANIGSAGYLDSLASLEIFLQKLAANGYKVEMPPGKLLDLLLSHGVVNSPRFRDSYPEISVDAKEYSGWSSELPQEVQQEIQQHWGLPPGEIMVEGNRILIPGIILGNIFVGLQPSRGVHEDPQKAYHDKDLPPHHQYICFYKWLEKEFKADALIHWGMHGTLEFTRGKEIALSETCYPDILIGNIPHLYYYWVGNTSESTIAKRRGYAVTVSHASPPTTYSDLYGAYLELEDLVTEHDNTEDKDKERLEKLIKEKAGELNLDAPNLEALKLLLYRLKRRLIPKGLHIIDQRLEGESMVSYLTSVLRLGREVTSLQEILAERHGQSQGELAKKPKLAEEIEKETQQLVAGLLEGNQVDMPEETKRYILELKSRIDQSDESGALFKALSGEYLLPNLGGDPIRTPGVFPVGRNMYEFDPRLIPTHTALRVGEEATSSVLSRFYEKYGRYPESLGLVLWGFETVKTGGDTIAQILSYLGVRLVSKASPWFKDLELIPLEELGRPRIDVVITICGIFRDLFGTHIDLLNKAVELAAGAEEPPGQNYIRKHYLEARDKFGELAKARIFGPSDSEYATSMRTLVESSNWREENELAASYDDSMSHAYWGGRTVRTPELFQGLVSRIDVISQERDNTEYEFTDLDHYYEFFGGLARSVKEKRGEYPDQWVVDTTEENLEVADVEKVIDRATRARTLNPKWIDGMLSHDFHGAQKIAQRVEYLLGLQATTGRVKEWLFDQAAQTLLFDEEMRRRLVENNRYATLDLVERMLEAHDRGYWQATPEELEKLKTMILDMEAWVE